jgi:predicted nucleic acid-binding protein
MDVLLDASAVMAIILNEPNRDTVIKLTENTMLISCEVISFEVGNALVNLYRKQKITVDGLLEAYRAFALIPFRIVKVNIENALKIACNHKIYAYDAYYLE